MTPEADVYSPGELERMNELMLSVRFHDWSGIELIEQRPGFARCRLAVSENTDGGGGYLHGGVLYGMFEVAAFFAAIPLTPRGHWLRSHAASFNLMRTAPRGEAVILTAEVAKFGRTTGFISVSAAPEGAPDKLVAMGQITKTVVPANW
ncbi:MAG: hypothetical protein KC561_14960 [Myxococcales bacterium]|nr:hypothetical protein [Myxococcales bacterium]